MTSRRQRLQPDHHIKSYAYLTGVFYDDFCPAMDESFVGAASSSDVDDAHQSIFECDVHIGSHCRDLSIIVSSSSSPNL